MTTTGGTSSSVGVLLPTREMAITDDYTVGPLLDFARTVEDLGFDGVWTGDSLFARPRLDPFVVLAAVSAVTSRVTVGTAALTPVLRHPLIGANLAASVDHASGGRLILCVGSGFPIPESELEFDAVGVPFTGRVGRLDENTRLWRQAWRSRSSGETNFAGSRWDVGHLDRLPPATTDDGPPIWLASSDTDAVLRRVALHYDGWMPFLPDPEAYGRAWRSIGEHAVAAGRPAGAVAPGLYATLTVNDDRKQAQAELEDYVQGYYKRSLETMSTIQAYGYGEAEDCARWLARYVANGARHIVIRIGSLEPAGQLKAVADALLPAVRAAIEVASR